MAQPTLWPTCKIVDCGTERIPEADTLVALGEVWAANPVALVAVQTPIMQGKTPVWSRSPVSVMRNAEWAGRVAGYFERMAEDCGFRVVRVEPRRAFGLKRPKALWQQEWDYTARTSEDARDAAVIARMGCEMVRG